MNYHPKLDRRNFLVGTAAAGSGLALGIPFAPESASAQGAAPELGVWVMIKPDDSVVVRMVRAEMGQGTVTGIAQLVAEELECDWSKISTEHPTPGESVERKRAVGLLFHRRKPRHPRVARIRASGRRGGAHDADPGGGERMEGAGRRNARRTRA